MMTGRVRRARILNNAWKVELYNQIDAAALNPEYGVAISAPCVAPLTHDLRPPNGDKSTIWKLEGPTGDHVDGARRGRARAGASMMNLTGQPITFASQHTGSADGNRLVPPGFANYVMATYSALWVVYTGTDWWIVKA